MQAGRGASGYDSRRLEAASQDRCSRQHERWNRHVQSDDQRENQNRRTSTYDTRRGPLLWLRGCCRPAFIRLWSIVFVVRTMSEIKKTIVYGSFDVGDPVMSDGWEDGSDDWSGDWVEYNPPSPELFLFLDDIAAIHKRMDDACRCTFLEKDDDSAG
jgi:hypothetical protein